MSQSVRTGYTGDRTGFRLQTQPRGPDSHSALTASNRTCFSSQRLAATPSAASSFSIAAVSRCSFGDHVDGGDASLLRHRQSSLPLLFGNEQLLGQCGELRLQFLAFSVACFQRARSSIPAARRALIAPFRPENVSIHCIDNQPSGATFHQ